MTAGNKEELLSWWWLCSHIRSCWMYRHISNAPLMKCTSESNPGGNLQTLLISYLSHTKLRVWRGMEAVRESCQCGVVGLAKGKIRCRFCICSDGWLTEYLGYFYTHTKHDVHLTGNYNQHNLILLSRPFLSSYYSRILSSHLWANQMYANPRSFNVCWTDLIRGDTYVSVSYKWNK